MIVAAASCPHPPLLLPGLTGGPVPAVEALRERCVAAVDGMFATRPDRVVVVSASEHGGTVRADRPSPAAGFAPGRIENPSTAVQIDVMPLGLAVGRSLLESVPSGTALSERTRSPDGPPVDYLGVTASATPRACADLGRDIAAGADRTALLVMADASARRGAKAPGYIDDAALAEDARLLEALGGGRPADLLRLDPSTALRLMIGGRMAWQVLAGAWSGGAVRVERFWADDPFGVLYPVVLWSAA